MSKPLTKEDLPDCKGLMCLVDYKKTPPCSIFNPIEYPVKEPDNEPNITRVYDYQNHYFQCYETISQDNITNKK
ncbi:hypothetical protein Klosneuvirus_2_122 [Klosneuvirus KNV1]|uniref:Uncharacterized protein n=1 Tax=Klosneuvirus KNV1 TaxID=1977640 RepID=A0A1V0SIX3_9VIRU|nr:hypothetical protein Klosneuvirus_2_122 [Klosneuvirus KNV1]